MARGGVGGAAAKRGSKVCRVLLSDIDAVVGCVQAAIADAEQRGAREGGGGEGGADQGAAAADSTGPEAGLSGEMSDGALLARLEAALRESAVPDTGDGCD